METFDVFEAEFFGLDGQILVIYAGGKPRLAYRRSTRDRWSPEIRPNTPNNADYAHKSQTDDVWSVLGYQPLGSRHIR